MPAGNGVLRRPVHLEPWVASAVAGIATGLAGGALARIAMRGVALLLDQATSFTIAGTLGILTIFVIFGIGVALLWTLVRLPPLWTARTRAFVLAGLLTALLIAPLYLVATGDLPNAHAGQIVRMMLLFLPIPILMGVGIEGVAGFVERRPARNGAHTLALGWAMGLGALAVFAFLSLFGSLMGGLRHPALVSSFLGGQTTAFEVVRDNALAVGLLTCAAYVALALVVFWRRLDDPQAPMELALLLAAPMLLLSGSGLLPLPLSWLPDAPWLIGMTRATGIALLLLFTLAAGGGFHAPGWLWLTTAIAWAVASLWLVAGGNSLPLWTEAAVWSMLALALAGALVHRLQQAGDRAAHWTALALTLFAAAWLGLWLAALLLPDMGLRSLSGFEITLRVTLFWLPWLLLPASLWPAPAPQPTLSPVPAA